MEREDADPMHKQQIQRTDKKITRCTEFLADYTSQTLSYVTILKNFQFHFSVKMIPLKQFHPMSDFFNINRNVNQLFLTA